MFPIIPPAPFPLDYSPQYTVYTFRVSLFLISSSLDFLLHHSCSWICSVSWLESNELFSFRLHGCPFLYTWSAFGSYIFTNLLWQQLLLEYEKQDCLVPVPGWLSWATFSPWLTESMDTRVFYKNIKHKFTENAWHLSNIFVSILTKKLPFIIVLVVTKSFPLKNNALVT